MNPHDARLWFAEDLRVSCHITSTAIIDALAAVPRERFLGPGPWLMRGMFDAASYTPADRDGAPGLDPSLVYHNVPIAIDPSRDLYNGQPGLIARWLDDLDIRPGARVVHIGAGTGYFSAILGHLVGPTGRVWAIEVDHALADRARTNLAEWPWIDVSHGDGRSGLPSDVDVVLVHAGATHVLDEWLDALGEGGRLSVPLTGAMAAMGATLGKGLMLRATRDGSSWPARMGVMVAIYSLVGIRDDAMNSALGQAMMTGRLMQTTRIRRDPHAAQPTCIVHGPTTCLSQ
jgi:protein-L-isoaspartate(D-aspartate) O-methyltransferase